MTRFDLTPLYRSSVGFDRFASLLNSVGGFENDASTYPPYNIERLGENEYRISMAVAGFGKEDLTIEVKENALTITGDKKAEGEEKAYLHRGIAARGFERRFQLADYVEVSGADVKDGMLNVDLKRELPEKMKPRTVTIGDGEQKLVEDQTVAV